MTREYLKHLAAFTFALACAIAFCLLAYYASQEAMRTCYQCVYRP
jgi:hypothetical protein